MKTNKNNPDSWDRYSKLVLYRLKKQDEILARQNRTLEEIKTTVTSLHNQMAILKFKVTAISSAVASVFTAGIAAVFHWFTK